MGNETPKQLQIAMFQTLFKLRKGTDGVDVNTAFASAIADTSDENFRGCLRERPELVGEWLEKYGRRR